MTGAGTPLRTAWGTVDVTDRPHSSPCPSSEILGNSLPLLETRCPHLSPEAPDICPEGVWRFRKVKDLSHLTLCLSQSSGDQLRGHLGACLEAVWLHPDPLNQNLHFNKIPGDRGCMKILEVPLQKILKGGPPSHTSLGF